MFSSIRRRLIASYVSITLLTLTVAGFFGLLGVRRYAEQREQEQLQAGAQAIAERALPLVWPRTSAYELQQLAQIAAFLGDTRVRILDDQGNTLVDSGSPGRSNALAWLTLPPQSGLVFSEEDSPGWIVSIMSENANSIQRDEVHRLFPFMDDMPSDVTVTIIRRVPGVWGPRFTLEERRLQEAPLTTGIAGSENGDELADPTDTQAGDQSDSPAGIQVLVPIGEETNPRGFVELSSENNFRTQALAASQQAFAIASMLALGLAVLLGLFMGRRISRPVIALTESARLMSEGDLSVRAEHTGKDEIGELAGQFNAMAARLHTSFDQLAAERDALRRFIADASHELRTPITALRNFNELLQGSAGQDEATRKEFLAESQAQIDRLAWFTSNLLDLSRLDGGIGNLQLEPVAVNDLLDSAAAVFQSPAHEKGIQIQIRPLSASLDIEADGQRLLSAMESLLDNAIKYAPEGSQVTLGADRERDDVCLWVEDQGTGILESEKERIFERFYRGAGNHAPGNGLGLAIAKSIVEAHGGGIHSENTPSGGARFTLRIPLSQAKEPYAGSS